MESIDDPAAHRGAMGKRIAQLRKRAKLTQTALALKAGISQPSLWAIEEGDTKEITARTLLHLAAALDTTIEYLWHGAGQSKNRAVEEAELAALFRQLQPNARMAVLQTVRTMYLAQTTAGDSEAEDSEAEAAPTAQNNALAQKVIADTNRVLNPDTEESAKPHTKADQVGNR